MTVALLDDLKCAWFHLIKHSKESLQYVRSSFCMFNLASFNCTFSLFFLKIVLAVDCRELRFDSSAKALGLLLGSRHFQYVSLLLSYIVSLISLWPLLYSWWQLILFSTLSSSNQCLIYPVIFSLWYIFLEGLRCKELLLMRLFCFYRKAIILHLLKCSCVYVSLNMCQVFSNVSTP